MGKKPNSQQVDMFTGNPVDMPLFSGTAQKAKISEFKPVITTGQLAFSMINGYVWILAGYTSTIKINGVYVTSEGEYMRKLLTAAKFPLGEVVMTQGIVTLTKGHALQLFEYLAKHKAGDWGDLSDDDKAQNDLAVNSKLRILSAYETPGGKIWIITEADRSSTCILLPSEY